MILVTGHIDFDPARRDDFLAALEPLVKGSLADPGCLQYTFSADFENPGRVHVTERWETEELMQAHMAMPHFGEFGQAMRSVGVRAVKVFKHEVTSSKPLFGG
jgi:quinol monooxygenase YgiN